MATLVLTPDQKHRVWQHLIPAPHDLEEAAFLFVRQEHGPELLFVCQETRLLGAKDLAVQLPYHIELADHIRPQLIKQAHDSGLVLVEVHSHRGDAPVRFSKSDLCGFEEWVPHVRWRLKGRPYAAVVVANGSFDGFIWIGEEVERLDAIEVGGERIAPTALSPFRWIEEDEEDE